MVISLGPFEYTVRFSARGICPNFEGQAVKMELLFSGDVRPDRAVGNMHEAVRTMSVSGVLATKGL